MPATALTDGGRRSGHKDWGAIIEDLHVRYPGTRADRVAIRRTMAGNHDVMAAVLRDVLLVSQSPVRRGQRSMPDLHEGLDQLRTIRGEDYTTLPFHRALQRLAGTMTLPELAEATGLSASIVYRLKCGENRHKRRSTPTKEEMETIAAAFAKKPIYFVEYRALVVSALVHNDLLANPEMSAGIINRLR